MVGRSVSLCRCKDQLSAPRGARVTVRGVKMVDPGDEVGAGTVGDKGSDFRTVDDDWLENELNKSDDSDYPTR